jgi:hypothetical protein
MPKFTVLEEESLLATILDSRVSDFEKQLTRRFGVWDRNEDVSLTITSDDRCALTLRNGKEIGASEWVFLGVYSGETAAYSWRWPWNLVGDSKKTDAIKRLVLSKFGTTDDISFSDPMIVSYIQSLVLSQENFEYIYNMRSGGGAHSCFGLVKIDWVDYNIAAHSSQLYYGTIKGIRV